MGDDYVTFRDSANIFVGFLAGGIGAWAAVRAPHDLKIPFLILGVIGILLGVLAYFTETEDFRDNDFISRSVFGLRRRVWSIDTIDHFEVKGKGQLWLVSSDGTAAAMKHSGRYDSPENLNSVLRSFRKYRDGLDAIAI